MRSWLIAPADNDRALAVVASAGADVVVLDLARALDDHEQEAAREAASNWIRAQQHQVLASRPFARWVRIAGLDTPQWREDLVAVLGAKPEGIILSDCRDPEQLKQLAATLYEMEHRLGIPQGQTQIVPQLAGSARGALAIAQFGQELHSRVTGLTWDAALLARAIGARRVRQRQGRWSDTMAQVRTQVLLAAHAQGLLAIESPWRDPRDRRGTFAAAKTARDEGFTGMLAIHPAQVAPIGKAFTSTAMERAEAEAIVAGFASNSGRDTVAVGGRRIDTEQLQQAQRLLEAG